MMKLIVNRDYKSLLLSTHIEELSDFTILTGENGSGKSQLLDAILYGYVSLIDSDSHVIISDVNKDVIKRDGIYLQQENYSADNVEDVIRQIYSNYLSNSNTGIPINGAYRDSVEVIKSIKRDSNVEALDAVVIREWINRYAYKSLPFETNQLMRIFSSYYCYLANNLVSEHYGEKYLSKEEFIRKYGESPWDILNNILYKNAKLNFKFLAPNTFEPCNAVNIVCENDLGKKFPVVDLSSGEKVLLTIALSLYSAENDQMKIPKIILLDEADSFLHPTMIQNLLYLIENIFVEVYKIKVIMTTHSPTTVALAKDENLFYMQSDYKNRIVKVSKDNALKRLAYGIPTLSVVYSNRKNVITESSFDAKNLEDIYTILVNANYLCKDISLNFIASGLNNSQNSGDCNNVINIVDGFTSNSNVYGIIDWDCKNNPVRNIRVLAHNERYSIENCILDPVVIALLLLYELKTKVKPEEFGLSSDFILVKHIDEFYKKMQVVADSVVSAIASIIPIDISNKINISYANGIEISISAEYLGYQGHQLEDTIKDVYPQLKAYHNSNDLKQALIKVLSIYPQFTPMCFVDVFQKIIS